MTVSKDDERDARLKAWLRFGVDNSGVMLMPDDCRTILALLDAPRMPRPENLTNDVLDAMHAAHSVSLNTHEQFTFVRNAMRAAYRALYDHYNAPPKVEAWAAYHCSGRKCLSFSEEDARSFAGFNGRIVKLVEDRDGE